MVFCFQLFRNTFFFGKLFYQPKKHFFSLLVHIGKVTVQLARGQQRGIKAAFVFAEWLSSGSVKTDRFPSVKKSKYIKVGTGEKGFLGFEKKKSVESGYEVDGIFTEMIEDYYQAYSRFLQLLKEKENTIEE